MKFKSIMYRLMFEYINENNPAKLTKIIQVSEKISRDIDNGYTFDDSISEVEEE